MVKKKLNFAFKSIVNFYEIEILFKYNLKDFYAKVLITLVGNIILFLSI